MGGGSSMPSNGHNQRSNPNRHGDPRGGGGVTYSQQIMANNQYNQNNMQGRVQNIRQNNNSMMIGPPMNNNSLPIHNPTKIMVMNTDIALRKNSFLLTPVQGFKGKYQLSFAIDALVPVEVKVYLLAVEDKDPVTCLTNGIKSKPELGRTDAVFSASYQQATNLQISQVCEIDYEGPLKHLLEEATDNYYPLIIKLEKKKEGDKKIIYNYGIFMISEGKLVVSIKKQKMEYMGQSYQIDEIYGINNSGLTDKEGIIESEANNEAAYVADQEKECVVCFSDKIDTVIMPCRHMCLCINCAQALQAASQPQARKCPICRKNIESFIRIKRDDKGNNKPPTGKVKM